MHGDAIYTNFGRIATASSSLLAARGGSSQPWACPGITSQQVTVSPEGDESLTNAFHPGKSPKLTPKLR
jgi:phage baseplate assembly protein gpV